MEEIAFVYKNLFMKQVIQALDDKVITEIKNLSSSYRVEYKYSDLNSSVVTGRIGDVMWSNIGWYLLLAFGISVVFVKIVFPEYFYSPSNRIFLSGLAGLSLIMFSLRLLFKHDCIWIKDKEGDTALFFRLTKHNFKQGERVKDFIINQIKQAEK